MKLLRRGRQGFLTVVIDKKEAELKFEDIALVKKYPDVFLEELPGLPLTERLNSLLTYSQDQALSLKLFIEWLQQK